MAGQRSFVALLAAASGARTFSGLERHAIAGALIAFTSAQVTFRLRRALGNEIPGFAAGLVEAAAVVGAVVGAVVAGAALVNGRTATSVLRPTAESATGSPSTRARR